MMKEAGIVHPGYHYAMSYERAKEMDKLLGPDNLLWYWEEDQWNKFERSTGAQ